MTRLDHITFLRIKIAARIGLSFLVLSVVLLCSCTPASDLFLDIRDLVYPAPPPGSLDTSFGGGDGKVTTPIGSGHNIGYALGIQTDGKILVAGHCDNGTDIDIALVRYTIAGSLDTIFGGGDGIVTTPIGSGDEVGYALGIQQDGKILVAGYSHNGTDNDIALVRYTTTGSPDTTFGGGDGIVTTPIGSGDDRGYALGIQTNGKILVAGSYNNGVYYVFALVRYTTAGDTDNTFGGGDGIVTTDISSYYSRVQSLRIQMDGKILVAGYANTGSSYDIALTRYTTTGDLDTTFGGGDGIVTTAIGSGYESGNALAIQLDSRILVAGNSNNGTDDDIALVRYTSTGSLDSTFGGGGIVTTPIGSVADAGNALEIQADGKILVAGGVDNGTDDYDFALVRYLP